MKFIILLKMFEKSLEFIFFVKNVLLNFVNFIFFLYIFPFFLKEIPFLSVVQLEKFAFFEIYLNSPTQRICQITNRNNIKLKLFTLFKKLILPIYRDHKRQKNLNKIISPENRNGKLYYKRYFQLFKNFEIF